MSNEVFETLAIVAVLAGALACILTFKYGSLLPIVLTNIMGAGIIVVVNAEHIGSAIHTSDWGILLIFAFAILTIATNLFWFVRPRLFRWPVWVEFLIYSLLSVCILIFVFTFRMTRLF